MKKLIYIFLLFSTIQTSAQVDFSNDWFNSGWQWSNADDSLVDVSYLVFKEYDFSQIIGMNYPNSYNLEEPVPDYGVFGKNYEKIEMYFSEVKKSTSDSSIYSVVGKSKYRGKVTDFKGKIILSDVIAYLPAKNSDTVIVVKGYYNIDEYPKYGRNGTFKGAVKIILYSHNLFFSKLYFEQEDATYESGVVKGFVGVWQQYKTDKQIKCIWGFSRFNLNYFEDFDDGAGEAYINIKYAKSWFDYTEQEWEKLKTKVNYLNIFNGHYIHQCVYKNKEPVWYK